MVRAWNEMSQAIRDLKHFLDAKQSDYPEWKDHDSWRMLRLFRTHKRVQYMSEPVYIVEEVGTVVTKVNAALTQAGFSPLPVYYMYGHPLELLSVFRSYRTV